MAQIPQFIKLKQALKITGHPNPRALSRWVDAHNRTHPRQQIKRRWGAVDRHSLVEALETEAARREQAAARLRA